MVVASASVLMAGCLTVGADAGEAFEEHMQGRFGSDLQSVSGRGSNSTPFEGELWGSLQLKPETTPEVFDEAIKEVESYRPGRHVKYVAEGVSANGVAVCLKDVHRDSYQALRDWLHERDLSLMGSWRCEYPDPHTIRPRYHGSVAQFSADTELVRPFLEDHPDLPIVAQLTSPSLQLNRQWRSVPEELGEVAPLVHRRLHPDRVRLVQDELQVQLRPGSDPEEVNAVEEEVADFSGGMSVTFERLSEPWEEVSERVREIEGVQNVSLRGKVLTVTVDDIATATRVRDLIVSAPDRSTSWAIEVQPTDGATPGRYASRDDLDGGFEAFGELLHTAGVADVMVEEVHVRLVEVRVTAAGHHETVLPFLGDVLPEGTEVTIAISEGSADLHITARPTITPEDVDDAELSHDEVLRIVDVWNGDTEPADG
ncbi:hypothetical protein ACQBAT_06670 [Ornithinimicrobium sp. Y1847]|uniref:hypothetical protein n=1 Tax=Ornithinimicrobium sp. Y1847 TaxID=3405419 RepID=UPI003B67C023